jgi:hypothetical protein
MWPFTFTIRFQTAPDLRNIDNVLNFIVAERDSSTVFHGFSGWKLFVHIEYGPVHIKGDSSFIQVEDASYFPMASTEKLEYYGRRILTQLWLAPDFQLAKDVDFGFSRPGIDPSTAISNTKGSVPE